jgi:alpha-L-rhamnosidase
MEVKMISELHGAKWIGVPQEELYEKTENILVYFRTKFHLKKLGNMQIAVSGHSRYKLWVNGHRAVIGLCRGNKRRNSYEMADVGKFLVIGENIIAAEVLVDPPVLYSDENAESLLSKISNVLGPLLIIKGSCKTDDGRVLADVTTGKAEWMVSIDEAVSWTVVEPKAIIPENAFEKVIGTKLPWGWKTDRDIDGRWMPVVVRGEVDDCTYWDLSCNPFLKRPIPLLLEIKKAFTSEKKIQAECIESFTFGNEDKVVLPPGTGKVIDLDAGELTIGYFFLKTFGGSGSRVSIQYAEGMSDIYYPSGNYDIYEPFWFRHFRFVRIEVKVGEEQLILFKPSYMEAGCPYAQG